MAVEEGFEPTLKVSKASVLPLHHSTISVARLSELSSVRPLCQRVCILSTQSQVFPRRQKGNYHEHPYGNREHHQPDTIERR